MIDDQTINRWIETGELTHDQINHAKTSIDQTGALWQFLPPADFIALAKSAPERPDDFFQQRERALAIQRAAVEAGNREHDRQLASAPMPDERELRAEAERLQVNPDDYIAAARAQRVEAAQRVEDGKEAERQAQQAQLEAQQREAWEAARDSGSLWEVMQIANDAAHPHHLEARREAQKQLPSYTWPE